MVSLRTESSAGRPRLPATRAGRPAALRLLLLLGGKMVQKYETYVQNCWLEYKKLMDPLEKDWCDWAMIRSPYSLLRYCLEHYAEESGLGFPNPWAERAIFKTHQMHFANCSLLKPTFCDPPEDVLLAMIIAPICLIPFLVTLVVWQSKDNEAQA
ncbi:receptor activity-modifying protein 2 isoform X3 [Elephas maximus indicus]|uniref:receptor activity-modifying protein 2 isoform X3 n=1 Tax=Elephas maximus indicus TaxID=99487 RepID=UPI002116D5D0|nr:receptor activity-modifying protein 2 isoform X3 [Elephas maximus indicus]